MRTLSAVLLPSLLVLLASFVEADAPVYSRQSLEKINRDFGEQARDRIIAWRDMIAAGQNLDEMQKLQVVNSFFNQIEFVNDVSHWGVPDYWATPLETLTTNGGDCEDLSIAKYFALREMGVAEERLRLTYVKALDINQAHMVLAYFSTPAAEPLVLDNLITEIRSSRQRPDLLPVYSFNGDGLWLARERAAGKRVGGAERVGLWRDLLARMRETDGADPVPGAGADSVHIKLEGELPQ
ncbi:transglutaminase-like cysteine peptidase [Thiogranum longum]